jgi:hypothetical protein
MRSLGIAMAIGSLACMFVACVVLPTVLAAIAHTKSRARSSTKPHTPSGS